MNSIKPEYDQLLVNGAWRPSADGATIDVVNPFDENVIGQVPHAAAADLDDALMAAEHGWSTWRRMTGFDRSRILRRTAEILEGRKNFLADLLTTEQGKPRREALAEIDMSISQFDWFADEARRIYGRIVPSADGAQRLMVLHEPVGPVAAFTPWNFPSTLTARKLAPALAAGCSVILKPPEECPFSALALAGALVEAGLPDGVLNVVTGTPDQISTHLLASPIMRKMSMTGSTAVGKHLMRLAAENVTAVSLELGGHAPVLVFPDVDVAATAALCATGKFRNAGQVCISPTRFIVHESIADEFGAELSRATANLIVGDGMDSTVDIGPLANARRVDAVAELVDEAVATGATTLTGGTRPERDRGYFYQPTVLANVPLHAAIMKSEPFGPVAAITSFADEAEALRSANSTSYGLAAYAFTRDLGTATRVYEGLEAGVIGINDFAIAGAQLPFGGIKQSGIGSESGPEGIAAYTVAKSVTIRIPG